MRYIKAKLKDATFNTARNRFFDTIDTKEINKQLDSSFLDVDENNYYTEDIAHKLKERKRVTDLIKFPTRDMLETQALEHRIALTNALVDLGRLNNIPSERVAVTRTDATAARPTCSESSGSSDYLSLTPKPRTSPIALINRYYLFYIFSSHHQSYFSTSRKAREHFEKHLRQI